jgi:hypothetical protein
MLLFIMGTAVSGKLLYTGLNKKKIDKIKVFEAIYLFTVILIQLAEWMMWVGLPNDTKTCKNPSGTAEVDDCSLINKVGNLSIYPIFLLQIVSIVVSAKYLGLVDYKAKDYKIWMILSSILILYITAFTILFFVKIVPNMDSMCTTVDTKSCRLIWTSLEGTDKYFFKGVHFINIAAYAFAFMAINKLLNKKCLVNQRSITLVLALIFSIIYSVAIHGESFAGIFGSTWCFLGFILILIYGFKR